MPNFRGWQLVTKFSCPSIISFLSYYIHINCAIVILLVKFDSLPYVPFHKIELKSPGWTVLGLICFWGEKFMGWNVPTTTRFMGRLLMDNYPWFTDYRSMIDGKPYQGSSVDNRWYSWVVITHGIKYMYGWIDSMKISILCDNQYHLHKLQKMLCFCNYHCSNEAYE